MSIELPDLPGPRPISQEDADRVMVKVLIKRCDALQRSNAALCERVDSLILKMDGDYDCGCNCGCEEDEE